MHYLDNGATTWPKPEAVYQTMDSAFRQMFSPKRGTAKASRLGADALNNARADVAALFGVSDPSRVVFTAGCTHALNIALQAFPWKSGDEVVMSSVEHHALSRPVRKIAREKGVTFHVVPYTDDNPFDLVAYETLLKAHPRIRLVATTHASNVIGSILPVADIGRLAHEYGALYLVDAAQTAGVIPIDVSAMNIDLLATAGHKSLYGPPGVGVLYIGPNVSLNTFLEGGTGNDSGKHPMRAEPPDGFEVGTIPLPQILALAEGVRWINQTGLSKIHHHEMALVSQLIDGLKTLPGITIYGHQRMEDKTPVVSFNLTGWTPTELGAKLMDDYGIALRAGFHCAPMAHEALGTLATGGTVRASIGFTTTTEDVEALISALKSLSVAKQPA